MPPVIAHANNPRLPRRLCKLSFSYLTPPLSGASCGFLTLQVGQVILTLPHSLAQTNIIGGTILQLTFATWAMYTLYLLGELRVSDDAVG